jgi:hypothetical protein
VSGTSSPFERGNTFRHCEGDAPVATTTPWLAKLRRNPYTRIRVNREALLARLARKIALLAYARGRQRPAPRPRRTRAARRRTRFPRSGASRAGPSKTKTSDGPPGPEPSSRDLTGLQRRFGRCWCVLAADGRLLTLTSEELLPAPRRAVLRPRARAPPVVNDRRHSHCPRCQRPGGNVTPEPIGATHEYERRIQGWRRGHD